MIATDLASAAVAGTMAVFIDEPAALVALFGLLAVVTSPFAPASAAAMPNLVGEDQVARANSLVAMTESAGYLLGPLPAGCCSGRRLGVDPVRPRRCELRRLCPVRGLDPAVVRVRSGTESHPGVLAGVRLIRNEPVLRLLVAASMTSLLGMGIVNVAAYPLSIQLDGGTEGYARWRRSSAAAGSSGQRSRPACSRPDARPRSSWALRGLGRGARCAGAAPVLIVALAGLAFAGAGRGLGDVAETTLIQVRTEDAVRSRVFAAQDAAAHVAYSAAMVVGGVLLGLSGARLAFGTAAASALLGGANRLAAAASPNHVADRGSSGSPSRRLRRARGDTRGTCGS